MESAEIRGSGADEEYRRDRDAVQVANRYVRLPFGRSHYWNDSDNVWRVLCQTDHSMSFRAVSPFFRALHSSNNWDSYGTHCS